MKTENNIEGRVYDINLFDLPEGTEVKCNVETYSENGTLAVTIMGRPDLPEGFAEEFEGPIPFSELYGVATVNLPMSEELPLNVQFVDENNLPGIGDWLEHNGIAKPTGMMTRSGWCLYPAYEFNIPEHKIEEIKTRRMEINPVLTRKALASVERDRIYDIMDDIDRCMTLGELKQTWLDLPKEIREEVSFPDRMEADGHIHTMKQWEMKHRFTEPIPDNVKIYTLQEVKQIFEKAKADILKGDYPTQKWRQKDGEYTIKGDIQITEIHPGGGIFEYTNVYVAEKWDEDGKLLREFLAHDNSASDIMGHGPSLEYLPNGCTVYAEYMSSNTSDLELRNDQYTFSPKGSIIMIDSGDQYLGNESFTVRQTKQYEKAVEHCKSELHEGLNKVISKIESKIESQNSSKALKR